MATVRDLLDLVDEKDDLAQLFGLSAALTTQLWAALEPMRRRGGAVFVSPFADGEPPSPTEATEASKRTELRVDDETAKLKRQLAAARAEVQVAVTRAEATANATVAAAVAAMLSAQQEQVPDGKGKGKRVGPAKKKKKKGARSKVKVKSGKNSADAADVLPTCAIAACGLTSLMAAAVAAGALWGR